MIIFVKYVFKTVKIRAFPRLLKVNYVVVTSWKETLWHVLTNIGAKSNNGRVLKASKFLLQKYIQHAYNLKSGILWSPILIRKSAVLLQSKKNGGITHDSNFDPSLHFREVCLARVKFISF